MSDFAISNLPTLISHASASVSQASATVTQASATVVQTSTDEVKVDLRQALSFVIDEESGTTATELSEEELSALEQRRLDLIMWLLNLEARLTPYCADFA